MKRLHVLFTQLLLANIILADVIVTQAGDRIEDVTVKSNSNSEVIYVANDNTEIKLQKDEVSAILYDDGRYEESSARVKSTQPTNESSQNDIVSGDAKEFCVCAYSTDNRYNILAPAKYHGATVEYRVTRNNQEEPEDFKYLGTTPFFYVTQIAASNYSFGLQKAHSTVGGGGISKFNDTARQS